MSAQRLQPDPSFDYAGLGQRLGVATRVNEPMSAHTTMKVGGPAAWYYEPTTMSQTAELYAALHEGPLPIRVLGWGSNLVVADDGVRAAVIATARLHATPLRDGATTLRVLAGVPLPGLTRWCAKHGLSGLEFAEGIPAFVGGAVRMNAGANGHSLSELLETVTCAAPSGLVQQRQVQTNDFGYRHSFVAEQQLLVLAAQIRLHEDDPRAIKQRLVELRDRRRATQPLQDRSAGCAFTNWPDLPAGALIERLGLKGLRVGGAEVSTVHGNFVVNRGGATASDVFALIERVRAAMAEATGRQPRIEVEIWRDEP